MKKYTIVFTKNNNDHTATVLVNSFETKDEEINDAKEQVTRLFDCKIEDIKSVFLSQVLD